MGPFLFCLFFAPAFAAFAEDNIKSHYWARLGNVVLNGPLPSPQKALLAKQARLFLARFIDGSEEGRKSAMNAWTLFIENVDDRTSVPGSLLSPQLRVTRMNHILAKILKTRGVSIDSLVFRLAVHLKVDLNIDLFDSPGFFEPQRQALYKRIITGFEAYCPDDKVDFLRWKEMAWMLRLSTEHLTHMADLLEEMGPIMTSISERHQVSVKETFIGNFACGNLDYTKKRDDPDLYRAQFRAVLGDPRMEDMAVRWAKMLSVGSQVNSFLARHKIRVHPLFGGREVRFPLFPFDRFARLADLIERLAHSPQSLNQEAVDILEKLIKHATDDEPKPEPRTGTPDPRFMAFQDRFLARLKSLESSGESILRDSHIPMYAEDWHALASTLEPLCGEPVPSAGSETTEGRPSYSLARIELEALLYRIPPEPVEANALDYVIRRAEVAVKTTEYLLELLRASADQMSDVSIRSLRRTLKEHSSFGHPTSVYMNQRELLVLAQELARKAGIKVLANTERVLPLFESSDLTAEGLTHLRVIVASMIALNIDPDHATPYAIYSGDLETSRIAEIRLGMEKLANAYRRHHKESDSLYVGFLPLYMLDEGFEERVMQLAAALPGLGSFLRRSTAVSASLPDVRQHINSYSVDLPKYVMDFEDFLATDAFATVAQRPDCPKWVMEGSNLVGSIAAGEFDEMDKGDVETIDAKRQMVIVWTSMVKGLARAPLKNIARKNVESLERCARNMDRMVAPNSRLGRKERVFTAEHINDLFSEIGRVLQSIMENDQVGVTVCAAVPRG